MARLMLGVMLGMMVSATPRMVQAQDAPESANCDLYRITGYASTDFPGWTADGSTTTVGALAGGQWIAAASWNIPMGAKVEIQDVGTYRVADRGMLGPRHIDVLVPSRADAYALTSDRVVCWWMEDMG